ncbi:MAG: phosphotriesterase-related protein [Actinomycetota bacterium]|nr:phosphotriesterase-related protein [Actinomycetota bacterium]
MTPDRMLDAVTVEGPIPADALGPTLVHEHIFVALDVWLTPATSEDARRIADLQVGPEIEAELRRDPFAVRDNLHLDDDELAAEELGLFARAGGRTVVDLTLPDIGRDPARLQGVARATGLNVIMGCGHYIGPAHPPGLAGESVETIAERLVGEVRDGVSVDDGPPVRAGVIGEIGTSDPVLPAERHVLEAAALAQVETGAPLFVHLHPWGRAGHEALDVLERTGAELERVALCHLDPTLPDTGYHRSLAERGATVCYDIWGDEDEYGGKGMPTDLERIKALETAIAEDWIDRVAVAQDVCTKTQLRRHGGPGYAHLLTTVAAELAGRGHGPELVQLLLVETPRRLLSWA